MWAGEVVPKYMNDALVLSGHAGSLLFLIAGISAFVSLSYWAGDLSFVRPSCRLLKTCIHTLLETYSFGLLQSCVDVIDLIVTVRKYKNNFSLLRCFSEV